MGAPSRSTARRAESIRRPAISIGCSSGSVPRRRRAPQKRLYAASELADRERLRDVVVGAELEAEHLVELVVASGQHDDRHLALGAQALANLEPVELRQHDVQDDEVDALRRELLQRFHAVPRLQDPITLALQGVGEKLLDGVLVVDEEDGRGVGHVVLG
jgi:hypothetical protein